MFPRLHPRERERLHRALVDQRRGGFDPRQIASVAAGIFWDASAASGSGSAGFLLPEGNGKTTYDLVAAAAGTAPTLGTMNGQSVVQLANATPDQLCRTATTVTRGFTGALMVFGWFSVPGSAPGSVLGHWRSTNQLLVQLNTSDIRLDANDGSVKDSRFPGPTYANGPVYVEWVFDPTQSATNRLQAFIDRVQLVPTTAPSMGTSILDSLDFISLSGVAGDGSNFNINADFKVSMCGITNGIPSDAERDLLFGHRALK